MTEHPLKTASLADKIAYVRLIVEISSTSGPARKVMKALGLDPKPLIDEYENSEKE
ncbi:hypothetical protein ACCZ74_08605 [Agrobacterium vitis]|uniref:hypothetical protein n=1 Tax=Agrobacterium vitis TaxID=373 RepID=UPI00403E6462